MGSARSLSRAFCVAAFSATFLISSCSRTLVAVCLLMSIRVALARACSSACLHLRDGVGLVDWAGEGRIGGCAFGRACCALAQSDTCSLIDLVVVPLPHRFLTSLQPRPFVCALAFLAATLRDEEISLSYKWGCARATSRSGQRATRGARWRKVSGWRVTRSGVHTCALAAS